MNAEASSSRIRKMGCRQPCRSPDPYAGEQQRPVAVEAGMSKKLTRRGNVASQTTATTSP
jgi:hypothetical protein